MACDRPTLSEVRHAIGARIYAGSTLRIEDVAGSLYISKSTLQRTLQGMDTTFTEQRRQVQVEVALKRLINGASCASAAFYVGLSGDHLCKLVSQRVILTPRQIVRACQLADRGRRLRYAAPPPAGTRLYFKQLERWRAIDAELERILADLPSEGELAGWARKLRRLTRRPDYRRRRYRSIVRAARRKENARFSVLLRTAVREQRHYDSHNADQGGGFTGFV